MLGVPHIGRAVVVHTADKPQSLLNVSLQGSFYSSLLNNSMFTALSSNPLEGNRAFVAANVPMRYNTLFNWAVLIVDAGISLEQELIQFRAPLAHALLTESEYNAEYGVDAGWRSDENVPSIQVATNLTPSAQNVLAYGCGMVTCQPGSGIVERDVMRATVRKVFMERGDRLVLLVKPLSPQAFLDYNASSTNEAMNRVYEAASRVSGQIAFAFDTTESYAVETF